MYLPNGWRESWEQRDDGNHTIVVIFSSLHRGADNLEWDQIIIGVGDAAFWLTKRLFLWSLSLQTQLFLMSDSRSTSKAQAFDRDDTGARNPFQLRGTLELFSILK